MRLKHLTLHGFKTFVSRTDFDFGEGLTAIVGPNGSGKSNIADAVRWALGEQSLSQLRAKRTEDLIFAGSSNRPPVGMAEVSITLDNSDHLLPLSFAEVTLTRRAFRSGENEYYINKSRVRLRDILDVASTLGQAYTVVGQGLVDAALSLRPEERRELFEEAAAIRGYFAQREEALKRLNKSEENVARVNDLLSELEPQVRRLERQARQAQEYGKLDAELREELRRWYAARWAIGREELRHAEQLEQAAQHRVEAEKAEASTHSERLASARQAVWERIEALSALHERHAELQSRHAAVSQTRAVLTERLSATRDQKKAAEREEDDRRASVSRIGEELAELASEIESLTTEMSALQNEEQGVSEKIAALEGEIRAVQGTQGREAEALENLKRRQARLQSEVADITRQQAEQVSARNEAEAALGRLGAQIVTEEAKLSEYHTALGDAQKAVAECERGQKRLQSAVSAARQSQAQAEAARREKARQADALSLQIASLTGEQQASLYGGVRAVVQAAEQGRVSGYRGTVAEILRVPTEYEAAIEAALGGRLQEVVVSRWEDAEQAISLLKSRGAGRATFLPLDTLRSAKPQPPPHGTGIIGSALDLAQYDGNMRLLAETMLGRLLIVEDLASARRTIAGLPQNAPWTLATMGGEVVRPGGSVTGGSNTRADDSRAKGRTILARERKRRELEGTLQTTREAIAASEKELAAAINGVGEVEALLDVAGKRLDEARRVQLTAQGAHMDQQGIVSRIKQELAWRSGLLADAKKSILTLKTSGEEVASALLELDGPLAEAQGRLAASSDRLSELAAEREGIREASDAGRTRLAVLGESLGNLHRRRLEAERRRERATADLSELARRLAQVCGEAETLAGRLRSQAEETEQLAAELGAVRERIEPSEREVRLLEEEVGKIEAEVAAMQSALLESETAHSRAAVERQRALGVLQSLHVEIAEELGATLTPSGNLVVAGAAGGNGRSAQEPYTKGLYSNELPEVPGELAEASAPETVSLTRDELTAQERRVYALKARLSRLGPVNPLATEEHAVLSQRHDYLQSERNDLLSAAESLLRVIGELDRTMREQFASTFAQVGEAFQSFFSRLFGGGTARLELTNPEEVALSGIEISAQPPGKRMQPLAALSGGERALTSVALLCALLKVRPVPFCVLDEVDAALDESNVNRFRSALQDLGEKTQFIVVTHNRGTIEAADTLYGVSMAGDGTSQMLSLKVEVEKTYA